MNKRYGLAAFVIVMALSVFVIIHNAKEEKPKAYTEPHQDTETEKAKTKSDEIIENLLVENDKKDFEIQVENKRLLEKYSEVVNYIQEYELPKTGVTRTNDDLNTVEYENGYHFSLNSKRVISRTWDKEDGPKEPTEGQRLGVVIGLIEDIDYEPTLISENDLPTIIEKDLFTLYDIFLYAENYPVIQDWAKESYALLEEAQILTDSDFEKAMDLFLQAHENIADMSKVMTLAAGGK
ncbi:hypothetical protein [Ornithinibacillus contaminans]|uniref:hypothetical protein n=1 Tax=Ornithinibacillus contaminans TaxID=694055 RepID=UPI00064DE0D4|nr:hypothetical protein [Ornithinibacillus contaminans]